MERVRDINVLLSQQSEISLQERLVLEALQTIKNKNHNEDIFVRQAIITLDHMLLKFVKAMYGNSGIWTYEYLSGMGFGKTTGVLERYLADYQNCYHNSPPSTNDISYIHNSDLKQRGAYPPIHSSLTSLLEKNFVAISSEKRFGKGRPLKYQISPAGSQMLTRIENKLVKTIVPKKLLSNSCTSLPIADLSASSPSMDELIQNAEAEIANNNYPNALLLYAQAIERSKKETGHVFPELYYNKGICMDKMEKYGEALECYRSALTMDANYADAYFAIGAFYQRRNDFANAVVNLRKAHELQPSNLDVVLLLSETFYKLDRGPEAMQLLLESEHAISDKCSKALSAPAFISPKNVDLPQGMPEHWSKYQQTGKTKRDMSHRVFSVYNGDSGRVEKKSLFRRKIRCESHPVYGSGEVSVPSPSQQHSESAGLVHPNPQQLNFIKKVEVLSFNLGTACINNNEYELARRLLNLAKTAAPNDPLVKFVIEDLNR